MQIQHLKVINTFGARHIDMALDTQITLFAGRNGAGKSSIQEGVRMAFSGDTTRVKLKKDMPLIVSEGAKSAGVQVITDAGTASIKLPKHTHSLTEGFEKGLPDALPYVLNAQQFARMKEDDRRTFLFGLTNSQVTEEALRRMLKEAECDDARVAQTLPMLKSIIGFPAAEKFAAGKATEAKGAWQQITGEKHGSVKGESWEAEKPKFDVDALEYWQEEVTHRREDLNKSSQALGSLKTMHTQAATEKSRREVLQNRANRIDELTIIVNKEASALADLEEKVKELESMAGEAPKVGIEHDFARAVEYALDCIGDDPRASIVATVAKLKVPFDAYVAKNGLPINSGDEAAREALPEARAKVTAKKNAVQTNSRALKECETAAAQLADMGEIETVTDEALTEGEAIIAKLQAHLDEATAELAKIAQVRDAADSAEQKTADAKAAHVEVTEWTKLAKALGADGIPAQILAKALKPINTELRKSSLATGWRQASINPDMSITAEGRIYDLLCESEQWRVDAMIAEAISSISGLGVLMLDRVDVLEIPARVELLLWLDGRAKEGVITSALLFATLKDLPKGLPPTIHAVWLENGEVANQTERLAA
ncbi:AAA family ATPase [Paraburkholderia sediminicola]|uniref:AAA family ATPase n=1 Tax=Paraburkholderia sediminicola TaxID=458836 RepID=UPI0038BD2F4C